MNNAVTEKATKNPSPKQSQASTSAILDLVDQDLTTSLALLHLLEKEQTALQERDNESLRSLLEEKTALLNTLDAGAAQRTEILRDLKQPTDRYAWESLIDALGNKDLKEHWHDLKDTINECQQLNEINGKIIARSQQTVQRLLQIMRGEDMQQHLYGERGNTYSTAKLSQATVQV
ncbi:MAG: flagellar protein FlgN [Cellvibrionaceae bacterium]|nr:flagellar protein FlgN [Cellvibrionaceae bacterium]